MNIRPRHITRLVFAAVLWCCHAAQAQPVHEVIVTGLRLPVAANQLPGSWSVVDTNTLATINPQHIQESLVRLPGVNMQHNNGQEYLPAIRSPALTGSGACGSFLMAEDGIPLRPAGFCNINELFESHFEQAQRIEVVRGPGITAYGSNAMHGIINVLNPAAINNIQQLSVDAGAHNYQRFKGHFSNDSAAIAITASHDDGFRHNAGADQQKLSLRWQHTTDSIAHTMGLTATNLNQETAGYAVGKNIYKQLSAAKINPNPEAFRDAQALRLWWRFEQKPTTNNGQPLWVITPYYRYNRMSFLQHFLPGTPEENNSQQSLGLQSVLYRYTDKNRFAFGVDMELVDGWLSQFQAEEISGSNFLKETIPQGLHYDYAVKAKQISPFVQWRFHASAATTLNLGTRYEHMRYDYNNLMVDGRTRADGSECGFGGCRYRRPADSKDNFQNWSHSAAIHHTLSANKLLAVTLARGFRAPQIAELYRLQRAQNIAELDSERLDSIEIALRGNRENTRYEVAIYAMEKNNVIYRDSDFFTISAGKTEHLGIETSLETTLSKTLHLQVAASYAKHRYAARQRLGNTNIKGNDVDSAPRLFGSTQLRWQATNSLQLELDWQYMGDYFTDPENLHEYSGHHLFNLNSAWQINPNTKISVNVLNLFDTRYAKRADYSNFSGDRYFPGEPLSVFASIGYQW